MSINHYKHVDTKEEQMKEIWLEYSLYGDTLVQWTPGTCRTCGNHKMNVFEISDYSKARTLRFFVNGNL